MADNFYKWRLNTGKIDGKPCITEHSSFSAIAQSLIKKAERKTLILLCRYSSCSEQDEGGYTNQTLNGTITRTSVKNH